MNAPKYIIIHCSATKVTNNVSLEEITKWHKAQGFKNIGYHYYITKDGTIHKGRDEKLSGAHTIGYNSNSIGICYEGGLDKNGKASDTRTPEQKQSLIDLILFSFSCSFFGLIFQTILTFLEKIFLKYFKDISQNIIK